jgi:hypothetical protein
MISNFNESFTANNPETPVYIAGTAPMTTPCFSPAKTGKTGYKKACRRKTGEKKG